MSSHHHRPSPIDSELAELNAAGYASDSDFNQEQDLTDFIPESVTESTIVVEGLPITNEARFPRLLNVIKTIFEAMGPIVKDGIVMPLKKPEGGGDAQTEGFCFIEYASRASAIKAVNEKDGANLDTKTKMRVLTYPMFEKLQGIIAGAGEGGLGSFAPQPPKDLATTHDALSWLSDEASRDQFLLISRKGKGNTAESLSREVLWQDGSRKDPALEYGGPDDMTTMESKRWMTSQTMGWSPRGTYLVSQLVQGVALWQGASFVTLSKFPHKYVRDICFSPNEQYLYTSTVGLSAEDAAAAVGGGSGSGKYKDRIIVWDIRTSSRGEATILYKFKQRSSRDKFADLKWSPDGQYLARLQSITLDSPPPAAAAGGSNSASAPAPEARSEQVISIYELPKCNLLDKKSIITTGAIDFSWSPAGPNLLAWWKPELNNKPTAVQILEIPSRKQVGLGSLFDVDRVDFVWHPQGSFLAVLAAKKPKGAKRRAPGTAVADSYAASVAATEASHIGSSGYIVQVYRVKERARDGDCPSTLLDEKERVRGLYWEPNGVRFALVLGDGEVAGSVAFYRLSDEGTIQHIVTLESRQCNEVAWSPRGDFCVLAGTGLNWGGKYEFYDVERRKTLATDVHPYASGFSWDPSGRVFASYKTSSDDPTRSTARDQVDNGYVLFSVQGVRFCERMLSKVTQFEWRPRPPTLLSEEEVKNVAKNIKAYAARYQEMDSRDETRRQLLAKLRKLQIREEFRRERRAAEELVGYVSASSGGGSSSSSSASSASGGGGEVLEEVVEEILSEKVDAV